MTFCRTLFIAAALVCNGCGDDDTTTSSPDPDLAAPFDFTVPSADLATPTDLVVGRDWSFSFADGSGLCDSGTDGGNTVAGTCVQTFFAQLAACWVTSGMCTYHKPANHYDDFCWESGAGRRDRYNDLSMPPVESTYARGETICMKGPGRAADGVWTAPDGSQLSLVVATGDVTCPDGSHVTIGPNYGNCAELKHLLLPEQDDQCPINNQAVSCPPAFPQP